MNLDEPLRTISGALAGAEGRAVPIGSARWHVLFGDKQRPLLMPADAYRFQAQGLRYFVGNRLKALYAKTLLKANSLIPNAGFLPEFRLPRGRRSIFPCALPVREPSHSAIQIGTSGPYQKASMLLMSERGEALALAKVAMVPSADRMVTIEANWLKDLADLHNLTGQVPRLLAEGAALNGRRYLVTTLAPSTKITSAFTPAHARFLGAIGRARLDIMRRLAVSIWNRRLHSSSRT